MGASREGGRPDRIVILGTNHFGEGTGVVGCDKGYATPLGVSPVAQDLIAAVRRRLGPQAAETLFANRYDHEREHSIELQMPWVHHVYGSGGGGSMVPVFGALIHDPTVNAGESYDGKGLALDPFLEALRGAMAEVGGTTLVISSADLSHVGPAFGDQDPVAGDSPQAQQMREKALNQDREMLQLLMEGKPDELMASMSWQQNPTRWCSIGNLVAAMKLTGASAMDLLSYSATVDAQGHALVSSASLSMK